MPCKQDDDRRERWIKGCMGQVRSRLVGASMKQGREKHSSYSTRCMCCQFAAGLASLAHKRTKQMLWLLGE